MKTLLVSGHFAEESGDSYIDIFSCKPYRPHFAAEFCRRWFDAATVRANVTLRQAGDRVS